MIIVQALIDRSEPSVEVYDINLPSEEDVMNSATYCAGDILDENKLLGFLKEVRNVPFDHNLISTVYYVNRDIARSQGFSLLSHQPRRHTEHTMLADPLVSIFWSLPLARVSFGQVTSSEAETRRSKFLKRPQGLIAAQKQSQKGWCFFQ